MCSGYKGMTGLKFLRVLSRRNVEYKRREL